MIYKVNFDYENKLFELQVKSRYLEQIQKTLEFIFFFIEKSSASLLSKYNYPNDYLKNLESFGVAIPNIVKEHSRSIQDIQIIKEMTQAKNVVKDVSSVHNWWGELSDYEHEKMLNSKETSFTVLSKYKLNPLGVELVSGRVQAEKGFIYKPVGSFSGFKKESALNDDLYLKEPFFDVVFNMGHKYDFTLKKFLHYISFQTKNGAYAGGAVLSHTQLEKLLDHFDLSLSLIEENLNKILKDYQKTNFLQIDSMIYQEGDKFFIYTGHDINCRRTMGDFTLCLQDYFESSCLSVLKRGHWDFPGALRLSPYNSPGIYYLPMTRRVIKMLKRNGVIDDRVALEDLI